MNAADALLDGFANVIARAHLCSDLDHWTLLHGYFWSVHAMEYAGLITFDEFLELSELYWAMHHQPEPALIEPRNAA